MRALPLEYACGLRFGVYAGLSRSYSAGVVFGFGIESEVWLFRLANFAHNDRTFVAGVGNDQPDGLFESTLHYSYANLLVAFEFQLFKSRNSRCRSRSARVSPSTN